ncbi:MAG: nitrous oxide reductase accessory protein NosL [Sphingomonadales bacterium]|nr:nitrous oxide reductase accessory protein NosL [Sphingomonadales bacterium]
MNILNKIAVICLVGFLASCGEAENTVAPPPHNLADDDVSYFTSMVIVEHNGPKGHVIVEGEDKPLWFSSVRDTLAFTRLPEETRKILAIYLTDMSKADTWDNPDNSTWAEAENLFYVVGSSKMGGMGQAEMVPFSIVSDAETFSQEFGGTVVTLDEIATDLILSPPDTNQHSH